MLPQFSAKAPARKLRQALGTAVFFGMLGVTGFGLFLTPVFYVVIMWFKERGSKAPATGPSQPDPPLAAEPAH